MLSRCGLSSMVLFLGALAGTLPVCAQAPEASAPAAPPASVAAKDKSKALLAITPEREAAVDTFVRRNHPELADLLAHLKANQSREFERAVRDLFRVSESLALVQERDPQRHVIELRRWQVQSRIHLLTARLRMGESEELKRQLKDALREQRDVKVLALQLDRQRAADRLQKADAELARLQAVTDTQLDQQIRLLLQPGGGSAKLKKPVSELSGSRPPGKRPAAEAVVSPSASPSATVAP